MLNILGGFFHKEEFQYNLKLQKLIFKKIVFYYYNFKYIYFPLLGDICIQNKFYVIFIF